MIRALESIWFTRTHRNGRLREHELVHLIEKLGIRMRRALEALSLIGQGGVRGTDGDNPADRLATAIDGERIAPRADPVQDLRDRPSGFVAVSWDSIAL